MTRRIAVIANEGSGSWTAAAKRQVEDGCRRAGLDAEVTSAPGRALAAAAERAAAAGADTLVAAGGDGTVSTVAGIAIAAQRTFGVIPLGTLNHFARDAGIPLALDAAVDVLSAGEPLPLDVGVLNGRTFLNNVSLGFYVRIVRERQEEQRRGRRKWVAFAVGLARAWADYRPITVRLTVDGADLVRRTPFVFIGNGEYQAEGLDTGRRCSHRALTGGQLAIFVAPECGRTELFALSIRALTRRLSADVKLESFKASHVIVETALRHPMAAVDGELVTAAPPLECGIRRGALRTLLPPRARP